MSLDPDAFRAVMGRFASGVTVVTATNETGSAYGMTVSAFASVSLQPPLVVMCIDHAASLHDTLTNAPFFAVNILASTQEPIARRFADTGAQRFEGIGYRNGENGVPILNDVLAFVECKRECQQQLVFRGSEFDWLAIDRHFVSRAVYTHSPHLQDIALLRGRRAKPPKYRAHAKSQLLWREWLGEIVISAQHQSAYSIRLIAPRREHENRDVRRGGIGAQLLDDVESRHSRQHEIEHDQRR
jgi:hypothetical protein